MFVFILFVVADVLACRRPAWFGGAGADAAAAAVAVATAATAAAAAAAAAVASGVGGRAGPGAPGVLHTVESGVRRHGTAANGRHAGSEDVLRRE